MALTQSEIDSYMTTKQAPSLTKRLGNTPTTTTPSAPTTNNTPNSGGYNPPPAYDPSAEIAALKAAQKQAAIAQLGVQRRNALSSLDAEKTKLTNDSAEQRNATSVNSQLGAKNFAEYMASRGQNNASGMNGTNDYATLARNIQYQGDISGINRNEQLGNQDIGRRTTLAEDAYNSGVSAADAQAEAQAMQMLINAQQQKYASDLSQYNADRTFNTSNDQWNKTFNNNKAIQDKNDYINSIKGLGNQFDYQAQINQFQNDNDPTNDWKILYLQQQKEAKVQNNLQNDIATIGQYGNDYQAEINRRSMVNPNDALIPYLRMAQAQKLQTMKANALSQQQQQEKDALAMFKELGYATPEIAKILNIPENAKTTDYLKTQYDTSRPYYKPDSGNSSDSTPKMTTQQKNQSMSEDIRDLTNMSVKDALNTLVSNKPQLIAVYGTAGFKQLWDTALGNAIRMGQAQSYNDYYKTQEQN